MSLNQPALVAITPQTPHQNNNSFIKNITTRSSFCGTPTSVGKSFLNNRKSWNGNGTLPLQMSSAFDELSPLEHNQVPLLATFKSKTGSYPRKTYQRDSTDADVYPKDPAYQRQSNGNYQRSVNRASILECEDDIGEKLPNLNGNIEASVRGDEILTPNGNTVVKAGCEGNEMRRSAGNGHGRRYAEIGNWGARSSTFLEPHIQGIGWRTAPDSDRGHDDHSTEDDEQSLIKDERAPHPFKKPSIFQKDHHSSEIEKSRGEQLRERFEIKQSRRDDVDGKNNHDSERLLKSKEFFENFQDDSRRTRDEGRTSREGNQRSSGGKHDREAYPLPADSEDSEKKENFHCFPTTGYRDSLSQSRESLSSCDSDGSDGEGARGDCEGSGSSSGSGPGAPCQVGLLERLVRTHPVWFLPGIQRAGAFHLLQGKEEGNFVVRQSSQADTMALSVRLPPHAGPYIEHYLIHAGGGRIGLETSQNKFDNIPDLIAHYSQCCDELPVQLTLPRALRDAKNRQQLSSLALLGQEFWRYPMANPKQNTPQGSEHSNSGKINTPNQQSIITPISQTPSDTGSSFSSFSISAAGNQQNTNNVMSPENAEANIVLNLSPIDGNPTTQTGSGIMSTFKGNAPPSPSSLAVTKVSGSIHTDFGNFVRAPRPTPPNTLNLVSSTAHITQQQVCPPQSQPSVNQLNKNLPPPPPPRWAKPPFPNPSNENQCFTPVGLLGSKSVGANITVTTTVTFSVNNHQNLQQLTDDELSSPNGNNDNSAKSDNYNSKSHSNSFDGVHSVSSNHACQNSAKRLSPEGECMNNMQTSLHGSLRRNNQSDPSSELTSPTSQNTPFSDSAYPSKTDTFSPINPIASPNGSNSVTSGIFSPSQINSPLSNTTMSSKSGIFSPVSQVTSPAMNKSDMFSPLSRSSPVSGKSSVFSPVSNQSSFPNNSAFNSPLIGKERERILSPNTNTASTTPSGRTRRSKHSQRKESRHYQESDILESPGVYYRSSLCDKVSDYEDIWGPDQTSGRSNPPSSACSTFKPTHNRQERDALGSGILISKRPDLLPDTLPKVTSLNGNVLSPGSPTTDNDSDKEAKQNNIKIAYQCIHRSTEKINMLIATTNSKGEPVPKRPDKLNLIKNSNEQICYETNEKLKLKDSISINRNNNEEIERENHKKNLIHDECSLLTSDFCNNVDEEVQADKQGSPFYADPVDAIKEAVAPLVQRRRIVRSSGTSVAQRYSEPPGHSHPYYPLRDMHSIEELSPSSPNTSNSVDNLAAIKSGRPRIKAVQPPRIKPNITKQDQTWTVDSSWEFISKQTDTGSVNENHTKEESSNNAFPSLAEQQSKLEAASAPPGDTLTIHQVLAQKFPELNLSPYPTLLRISGDTNTGSEPVEEVKGCRMSCYDNVEARLAISSQASDDGTVFSEPWDSSQWDSLIPANDEPLSLQSSQNYDGEDDDSSTAREQSITPPPGEAPLRLATISRAKSFRDRLDPLLAPPRIQALRDARRNVNASGSATTPGEGVRAYALHLAADKTTTFAQNVENFIACTKESKETCPHVVMRNMRQFMSGMKNYLVKHGEREFEKEVEKERLKLKANEFLNLDAILEGVLHGAVVTPLRSHVYGLLADKFARRGDVALLAAGMRTARLLPPLRLGIRPFVRVPTDSEMVTISQHFLKMQEADSPLDKLDNLLAAISAIFNSMKIGTGGSAPIGADDFLPVLVQTLSRCSLAGAELEAEVMAGLLPPPLLAGEGGYYLTTLFGAVAVLKRLAPSDNEKPYDWRTGSLGNAVTSGDGPCNIGGGGVARVLVPDEAAGALRRVALPWRPGARARDLCRALAHRARITNPQDYGLFALRDGEETLLGDGDCPQDVVSDDKYSNCMLAYKRIDAKIAWPKQAFSYP